MKIYKKLVLSLKTGDIVEEDSFEYKGSIIHCKDGGGSSSTSVDKKYNRRMAAIAEAQQAMAEEYFQYWKTDFKPYEQEQIAGMRGLLPGQMGLAGEQIEAQREYLGLQRPLAREYLGQVGEGVSAEEEMGKAKADVQQAYSGMEGETRRGLGRMGISPSSGRYAGLQSRGLLEKAKSLAGAGTMGRRYAEEKQFERLRGALA